MRLESGSASALPRSTSGCVGFAAVSPEIESTMRKKARLDDADTKLSVVGSSKLGIT
jgi:hypothetical protein